MKQARKTLNGLGWRYALFAVAVIVAEYAGVIAIQLLIPQFIEGHEVMLTYLLTIFGIDIVGFLTVLLLTLRMPKWEKRNEKLGAGNYFIYLLMCFSLMIIGAIIGNVVHTILSGSVESTVSELISSGTDDLLRILTVGILAPIFEELIFRKLLIDRLAQRGELLAILTSGLAFGAFHGNFSQFFYALGLGLLFAFVYVKTGRIRYTISYHMIINLLSSGVAVKLLELADDETWGVVGILGLLLYELVLYGGAIAGIVLFFINLKKFRLEESNPPETSVRGGKAFITMLTSFGLWLFMLMCAFEFWQTYSSAGSRLPEPLYNVTYTETVVVEDGEADVTSHKIPFEIEEDGAYIITASWDNDGDPLTGDQPGYLTAVCVTDSRGREVLYSSGSTASVQFEETELKAGEYNVTFYYISDIDGYREFLEDHDDPLAERSDGRLLRELWHEFGDDGEYEMEYSFTVREAA